jgi:putative transposase
MVDSFCKGDIYMSRKFRFKLPNGIYHIIVKGIKEAPLFKFNRDKEVYLNILSKYKFIHQFKIYAYCLVNTHGHFIIESNGADISTFMKQINLSYAIYYNNIYDREGHVFKDRFKSIVVYSNEYLGNLAAYIHNNPKDISGYNDNLENYKYSSLGIYLNLREDKRCLIDFDYKDMIMPKINFNNSDVEFFLENQNNTDNYLNDNSFYENRKSYLKRNINPENIISFVKNTIKLISINSDGWSKKHEVIQYGICILLIHSFSGISYKDIGRLLPVFPNGSLNVLRDLGYKYIFKEPIIDNFMEKFLSEIY